MLHLGLQRVIRFSLHHWPPLLLLVRVHTRRPWGSCWGWGCTALLLGSGSGPIFSGLLDIRLPFFVGQIFPNFSDLLDAIGPNGVLGLEIWVILIRIQNHGNCGLVS